MWTSEVLSSDRQPRTEPPVSGALYSTSVPLGSGPEVCGSDRLIWSKETGTQMGKRYPHLGVALRFDHALVSLPMRPPKPSSVSWLQALFVLRQDLRRLGNKHANLAWLAIGMDVPE